MDINKTVKVFNGDLGLVGHAGETLHDSLMSPKPKGVYTLTNLKLLLSLKPLSVQAKNQPVTLLVACMDARFAQMAYKYASSQLVQQDSKLLSVFVAGGIAQAGSEERVESMATIIAHLNDTWNLQKLVLLGHIHNCGGIAYINHAGVSVCDALGIEDGSKEERNYVHGKISESVQLIVPSRLMHVVQTGVVSEKGVEISLP